MGKKMETGAGNLTKRHTAGGWRWCGQLRYRDDGGKWHTMMKALTDADGEPIMTDADTKDDDGRKVQTTRNIRAARRALEAWRESVNGTPMGGRSTVPDYMDAYLNGREGSVQPSTMRKYREYARLVRRSPLDGIIMRDLDTKRVIEFVQWMGANGGRDGHGMALASIRTAYSLLSATCTHAANVGDIKASPCDREVLRKYAPKPQTAGEVAATKPNALDADGVRRANTMLDSTTNGRLRVGARMALACGLRASECCGLRWQDVDLDNMRVRIVNAVGRAEGETYDKPPKTPDSARIVPLSTTLARELLEWRDHQRGRWQVLADGQESAEDVPAFSDTYVVGWPDGSFMTPHALGNAWSRLAADGDGSGPLTGTRGRLCTFHDLRHTFATIAIARGGDARNVAALMGHKDASVTLTIYADALPSVQRDIMASAADVLTAGTAWSTTASTDRPDRRELTPEECSMWGCEPGTTMSLAAIAALQSSAAFPQVDGAL